MIKSKYIASILELLLDAEDVDELAKKQLPFITEENFDYTIGGLFVNFELSSEDILNFKVLKSDLVLNGVKIETTEFPFEADATLFFKDGLISYLEIWCYLGDYPKQELSKYTLTQIWDGSLNKMITTEKKRFQIKTLHSHFVN